MTWKKAPGMQGRYGPCTRSSPHFSILPHPTMALSSAPFCISSEVTVMLCLLQVFVRLVPGCIATWKRSTIGNSLLLRYIYGGEVTSMLITVITSQFQLCYGE